MEVGVLGLNSMAWTAGFGAAGVTAATSPEGNGWAGRAALPQAAVLAHWRQARRARAWPPARYGCRSKCRSDWCRPLVRSLLPQRLVPARPPPCRYRPGSYRAFPHYRPTQRLAPAKYSAGRTPREAAWLEASSAAQVNRVLRRQRASWREPAGRCVCDLSCRGTWFWRSVSPPCGGREPQSWRDRSAAAAAERHSQPELRRLPASPPEPTNSTRPLRQYDYAPSRPPSQPLGLRKAHGAVT